MIIKRSIVTTFTSCFLINLGALIALVSLLNINLFDFKTTWVILTVSAMLTLLYIVFFWIQYDEQKKGLTQDIEKILNNEKPDYEQLQALAKRQEEMSSELQTLSVAKNTEQEAIIEAERIRISRELHDSVSQELFAATMILSSVVDNPSLTTKQITSQTTLTLKILHEAQDEMRALLLHLRPSELADKSLTEGLNMLVDELQAKISAKISASVAEIKADKNIENNIFRMTQELLSNTLRHAKAQHIDISFSQTVGTLVLIVKDDGVGFDTTIEKTASQGLKNIKERTLSLGGTVEWQSAPGFGTTVKIMIPKIK
ncbi:MAG: sensor histidine kinase [Lactococcus sp.]|uniref:histidine kinase n=1 Tax=Pseudolactococcus piscium MKFS47 TaxID=297352 RepID=A0A0D6DXX2_9LACT|nr:MULTISPECIES: sensor histidine kinase [Lactococcus]MDN5403078.1 sensor histidine kinase [Lactococcus sp.]MDN5409049.1 sensor histidine kinase [Lactococcus sp.]MDN5411015.1 sensor histidine kinase [Lactococcus sp.]MDN5435736.1 sensor histidine kinase [Lactococcus sp.]MDN5461405.1 sensor histidine kinase [Lactococcus sp.]